MDVFITPNDVPLLTGDEPILPEITVRHFWAWALGDLRLNANRGMLAQFLVANAVGDARLRDDGWGNFDVLTPDGVKVEVKSSGYLQSWRQTRLSKIVFSGLIGRPWSDETGMGTTPEVRADVFVFAVHSCQDPNSYDPLDLDSWEFYVLPAATIRQFGQRLLGLPRVQKLAGSPITWAELRGAVKIASEDSAADTDSPLRTLVPRVIGQTEQALITKSMSRSSSQAGSLTHEEFMALVPSEQRDLAAAIMHTAEAAGFNLAGYRTGGDRRG